MSNNKDEPVEKNSNSFCMIDGIININEEMFSLIEVFENISYISLTNNISRYE